MESSKVFVVDDEPIVRMSLVALIESMGLEAEAFASASDFLQAFTPGETAKTCVLADLLMPDMSGLDLKQELLNRGDHVPVILLTGFCSADADERAESLEIFDILEKPCRPERLESVIRSALEFQTTAH